MNNIKERLKHCILTVFYKVDENIELSDDTVLSNLGSHIDELDLIELDMCIEEEFNIGEIRVNGDMKISDIVNLIRSKQ